jgi:hypothetical protein
VKTARISNENPAAPSTSAFDTAYLPVEEVNDESTL